MQRVLRIYCIYVLTVGASLFSKWCAAQTALEKSVSGLNRLKDLEDDSVSQKIKKYYAEGIRYKNGINRPIDYKKAFVNFRAAADLGDPQAIYATAYFFYKGFIEQSYVKAATLFKQGAYIGRPNSQYFLGLMYMNGYGLPVNQDSGRYWLNKAATAGYQQANWELKMRAPENNDSARALLAQIKRVTLPTKLLLNQFIAVVPEVPDSIAIAGHYSGFIITYDWSGQNVVATRKLQLELSTDDTDSKVLKGRLKGLWQEQNAAKALVQATLSGGILIFDSTYYSRTDHYSPERAIRYDLQSATLHLIKRRDSVFLTGDLSMFSPQRNEPSKPTIIALVRTDHGTIDEYPDLLKSNNALQDQKDSGASAVSARLLQVYPNPFSSVIQVSFEVISTSKIAVELYSSTGQRIYQKRSEKLTPGKYKIQLPAQGTLSGQTYILRLVYEGGKASAKLIRE